MRLESAKVPCLTLATVFPPQFGHVLSTGDCCLVFRSIAQLCRAGRLYIGIQKPRRQAVNLVASKRHIPQQ